MGKQKIIRMNSDGPEGTGLEFWGHLESEKVLEGEPVEKGYNYFTNATGQLTAGVWEVTPCKSRIDARSGKFRAVNAVSNIFPLFFHNSGVCSASPVKCPADRLIYVQYAPHYPNILLNQKELLFWFEARGARAEQDPDF
jgi:hypothetical protein